jgi:glycosyltransferase involved in cell wall biosynthesis
MSNVDVGGGVRATADNLVCHLLSFEGPDPYAMVGGLGTRVCGLADALAEDGFETHLWFVGDPARPGHEQRGQLHLHRWCQWISEHHPAGVYHGEHAKAGDYATSLPPFMMHTSLLRHLTRGGRALIIAEEWQTVNAVLHLDWLLDRAGLRHQVDIYWNANNIYGFDLIDWERLQQASTISTVSRYMKHAMKGHGVDPVVIPNGLSADAYLPPDRAGVNALRRQLGDRLVITKMARFDPDKRWLESVQILGELKRRGWKPLLIARGGSEPYGREVLDTARNAGLRVETRHNGRGDTGSLVGSLHDVDRADVIELTSHVDPDCRRVLFRASDVVLANSRHEPFGLVGLEAMAVGGIAATGCSGEDYAVPGHNALVLQTGDPEEFVGLYGLLRGSDTMLRAMRRAGRSTARQYAWPSVIQRNLLPRLHKVRPAPARATAS